MDRRVTIVGVGYVGLPLAVSFAEAGLAVCGVDAEPSRVAGLTAGQSHVEDVSNARLRGAMRAGLRFQDTAAPFPAADAVFVCVPTPVDAAKAPDLGPVRRAAQMVQAALQPGQLIVLQSTTFPGTTLGPFRAELEAGGLLAGQDFDLAFAPERVNPGDPGSAAHDIPRLVGGATRESAQRTADLLGLISDRVITMSSPDAAELAKLFENVFRNVNIALVNELALLCERMGLDVWEVIDGAATKPFGFMRFTPGPGVGGHCIPVDPYYLSWRAREYDFVDRFVELAGDINLAMPRHVVDLAAEALNDRGRSLRGSTVGVIGGAFKPNVADSRNSPSVAVSALLAQRGAVVTYHDPHVPALTDSDGVTRQSTRLRDVLDTADLVVVMVRHDSIDWRAVLESAPLILDTVNVSKDFVPRARQVFRLGAGWLPTTSPDSKS